MLVSIAHVMLYLTTNARKHLLAEAECIVQNAAILRDPTAPHVALACHQLEQLFRQALHAVEYQRTIPAAFG